MKTNVKSTSTAKASKNTEKCQAIASKNINDVFLNYIIETIENLQPTEWEHFLKNDTSISPKNAVSLKNYTRLNRLVLILDIIKKKRTTFFYATFSQITNANGTLKKGSKSIPIQYFNYDIKHKETKKRITRSEFLKLTKAEQDLYNVRSFLKIFRVFNVEDIENFIECDFSKLDLKIDENEIEFNTNAETLIQNLINNKELNLIHEMQGQAFYVPSTDTIHLPYTKYFKNDKFYYSTLFHEVAHWTGHSERLNRFDTTFVDNKSKYAFEELVAEICAMLFSFDFDYTEQFINSIVYLKGWLNQCKTEDKSETLEEAFTLSNKAYNYIKY